MITDRKKKRMLIGRPNCVMFIMNSQEFYNRETKYNNTSEVADIFLHQLRGRIVAVTFWHYITTHEHVDELNICRLSKPMD
jgi:hypothetical protein